MPLNTSAQTTGRRAGSRVTARRLARLVLPVLSFLMLTPSLLPATDYYVATNGNDSNPGTQASPFRTISKGVSVLTGTDDLIVKAGTYAEYVKIDSKSGTSSNPITIKRFGTDTVIVDGSGITPPTFESGFLIKASSHIAVDGIQSRDWSSKFFAFGVWDSSNITIQNCEGYNSKTGVAIGRSDIFTVRNCKVYNNNFHGLFTEDADLGTIDGVVAFDNINSGENDGIHIGTSRDVLVVNSIAYNNYEQGFDVGGHDVPASQRVTLRNCVAYRNGIAGAVAGFKVEGWDSDNIIIENALAYSNGWAGFSVLGASEVTLRHVTSWGNVDGLRTSNCPSPCVSTQNNILVENSIFFDGANALTVGSSTGTIALDYNNYWLTADDPDAIEFKGSAYSLAQFSSYQAAKGQDVHSLTVNPLFVNTGSPAGADGIFFTSDDGLLLSVGSLLRGKARDGQDMGYKANSTGTIPTVDPPANFRTTP